MPLFNQGLLEQFSASEGAYSQVTFREATGDKSVTLDSFEKSVLFQRYPYNTIARRGGVLNSQPDRYKDFIVHREGSATPYTANLSLVFPKAEGRELRLYFKSGVFTAKPGDYWYIYNKQNERMPNIGVVSEKQWEKVLSTKPGNTMEVALKRQQSFDDEDENYQKNILSESIKLPLAQISLRYSRNPSIALQALELAHYQCEVDSSHLTFESVKGKPYMECHHLIPVSLQERFVSNLDVKENIVILCPICHRHVHYGVGKPKQKILDKLWSERKGELKASGIEITYEEYSQIYNYDSNI